MDHEQLQRLIETHREAAAEFRALAAFMRDRWPQRAFELGELAGRMEREVREAGVTRAPVA